MLIAHRGFNIWYSVARVFLCSCYGILGNWQGVAMQLIVGSKWFVAVTMQSIWCSGQSPRCCYAIAIIKSHYLVSISDFITKAKPVERIQRYYICMFMTFHKSTYCSFPGRNIKGKSVDSRSCFCKQHARLASSFFQISRRSFCISDFTLHTPLHLSLSLPWSHAPSIKLHYSISIPIPFPKPELCDHPQDRYFMKQKRWVEIFIHEKYLSRAFPPKTEFSYNVSFSPTPIKPDAEKWNEQKRSSAIS